MKIELDIDAPDGYEFVRYGTVSHGEEYVCKDGVVRTWAVPCDSYGCFFVVRKVPTVPTLADEVSRLLYCHTGFECVVTSRGWGSDETGDFIKFYLARKEQ